MASLIRVLALVTSTLTASLVGQQTWVVDWWNGPGTDFTDLPTAYAAAAPGDILLLRSQGTTLHRYTPPPVFDRGVTIVGAPGPVPSISGFFKIRSLPASETLVFAGLELLPNPAVRANDNLGSIVIEHCKIGDRIYGYFGMRFVRCSLVTVNSSQLFCGGFENWFEDCLLFANDSEFREGRTPQGEANPYSLSLWSSTAYLANCYVQGGYELPLFPWNPPTYGSAMIMCNSTAYIGGSSRIWGGGGGVGGAYGAVNSYDCAPGQQPGNFWPIVHRDPSTSVVGAVDVLVDDRPGPVTALTLDQITSTSVAMTQHCRPNSVTLLVGGLLTPTTIPGLPFDVPLDPSTLFVIDVQPADPAGAVTRTLPIPASAPLGTLLGVQALELTASGRLLASNAVTVGKL